MPEGTSTKMTDDYAVLLDLLASQGMALSELTSRIERLERREQLKVVPEKRVHVKNEDPARQINRMKQPEAAMAKKLIEIGIDCGKISEWMGYDINTIRNIKTKATYASLQPADLNSAMVYIRRHQ